VAFLGDSFTFGCWTDVVETSLVGVFESRVARRGFEALNFGVGGYGFADEELLLQEEAVRFAPRYVVLVMFNGNDLRDTFLGLHKETLVEGAAVLDEENLRRKVPDAYVRKDLTASASSPESARMRRLRGFALFRMLAPFLRMENLSREFAVNTQFTSYSFWSHHPYPPVAREAKDASLLALERIAAFAAGRGIRFAVVSLPTRDQVYARETSGEEFDVDFPQAYVRIWARERGIPFLDLLSDLRARAQKTNEDLYVKGETHLNEAGHRITGERIAEWFLCCVAF
jgi:lysophospholipase L1-like esterase